MRRSLLASFGALAALVPWASAQVHEDWVRVFNGTATGHDDTYAVAVAASGDVYVGGHTGAYDALILKYDASGTLLWSRTFDLAGGIDIAYSLAIDPTDESVVAAGRGDQGSTRGLVLKYDAAGNLVWNAVYAAVFGTAQYSEVRLLPGGELIVAGAEGQGGIVVTKYDVNGAAVWSSLVPGGEYASDIAFAPSGDILVAGMFEPTSTSTKFGVTRLAPGGTIQWVRTLTGGGTSYESARAVVVEPTGAIYVAGRLLDPANAPSSALVKLDPAGNVLWTREQHGTLVGTPYYGESAYALSFGLHGNIRAGGVTSNSGSDEDVHVAEYSPDGVLAWQSTWDGPGHDVDAMLTMQTEVDGSLTALVRTEQPSGRYDPAVLRWSTRGTFRWADVDPLSLTLDGILYSAAFGLGDARVFGGRTPASVSGPNDLLVVQVREQAQSFCYGDGSGTACPCAQVGAPGHGCPNSTNAAGAILFTTGDASLHDDTLVLVGEGMPNGTALFFQGDQVAGGGHGTPFGDGLLCASGTLARLGAEAVTGGTAHYPSAGAPSVSSGGSVHAAGVRNYQVWYRNAATFCTSATFNLTNAVRVTWNS